MVSSMFLRAPSSSSKMPTGATAALQLSNGRRGKVMIPDSFMYGLEWTKKSDKKFDDCAWTKTRAAGGMHAGAATRGLQGDPSSSQRPLRMLTATQSNEILTRMQCQLLGGDFDGGGWSAKPLSAKPVKQLPPPSQRERPPTHKEVLSAVKTLENYLNTAERKGTDRSRIEQPDTDRSSASTLHSNKSSARSLGSRQGVNSTRRARPESALGLVSESGDSMVLSLEKGWGLKETNAKLGTRRSGRQQLEPLATLRSKTAGNDCVACEAASPERKGGRVVAKTRIAGAGVMFSAPGEKKRAATGRVATTAGTAKTTMRSQHGKDGDPLMDELFHRLETKAKVDRERQLHSRAQSRNARAHTSLGFREGQRLPGYESYDHDDDCAAFGGVSRLNPAVPSLDLRRIR